MRRSIVTVFALCVTLPTIATGATAAQAQVAATAAATAAHATSVVANAARANAAAATGTRSQRQKRGPRDGVRAQGGGNRSVQPATARNPDIDLTCGLDATLVLDESGSIGRDQNKVRDGAYDFLSALKNTNSTLRILGFSNNAHVLAQRAPVNDTTTGANGSLARGVANYQINGSTNWESAFDLARDRDTLTPELIIFMTDGDPNKPTNQTTALYRAIASSNTDKGQGTRILMVGVGNGVNNSASKQRLMDVSGPQIVTSASGLSGRTINQVDVAAFTDFAALGIFLRSVVTSLCGNSVTIQKLAQTKDGTSYDPASGWDMTVKPQVDGGFTWVDPKGQPDNTEADKPTSGGQGTAAFQWKPKQPGKSTTVTVTETVKSGYKADRYTCQITDIDGVVTNENGTITNASPSFNFSMKSSDVAACQLYNNYTYEPDMTVTKTAADKIVRGNANGWDEDYTFTVKNTGNTPLVVNKPVDSKCSSISGPTGPGSQDPSPRLATGDTWTYTCTGHIVSPTRTTAITYSNTVTVTATPPGGTPAITKQATESVDVKTPAVAIVKTAKNADTNTPIANNGHVPAGTRVTYMYRVTNTGNDAVKDVVVSDDKCSPLTRTSGSGTSLPVGDHWDYQCTTKINPPSSIAVVTNTATVTSNWSNPDNKQQNNGPVTARTEFNINVDRAANLRIIKATNPARTDQDFDFTLSGQGVPSGDAAFTLNSKTAAARNITLDGPQGGGSVYTVTEPAVTGWTLTGATCVDSTGTPVPANFDSNTNTITPTILPTQDVTCTFVNQRLPRLSVLKETNPVGSQEQFAFEVNGPNSFSDNFNLGDGESKDYAHVATGSYTIGETVPAGWDLDSVDCGSKAAVRTNNQIALDLAYGDDVECVFNNGELAPASLTIVKAGDPGSSPNFDFTAEGPGMVTPGVTETVNFSLAVGGQKDYDVHPSVIGTTYKLTETVSPSDPNGDWVLTDLECIRNGDSQNPIVGDTNTGIVEVDLAPGEDAVCVYTNKQKPRLTIVKQAVNPDDPGDTTAFTFTPTGLTPSGDFDLADGGTKLFTNVAPDTTVSVVEAAETDWTLTLIQCSGEGADGITTTLADGKIEGTLGYGDAVVCTYVNTKDAPAKSLLLVGKLTDPENSPQTFAFTATGQNNTPPNLQESFNLSDGQSQAFEVSPSFGGSTYTVTETPATNWDLVQIVCATSSDPDNPQVITNANSVDIEILPNEVGVCLFGNQERATLSITKYTDEATQRQFDFAATQVTPASFSLGDGDTQTFGGIEAGTTVAVTETVPTDAPDRWRLVDIECFGNSNNPVVDPGAGTLSIELAAGEDVECLYLNSKVPPAYVQVVKSADPADGTSFDFTAAGTDQGSVDPADAAFSLTPNGGADQKDLTVYPPDVGEQFTFTEGTLPAEWNLDDIECLNNGSQAGSPDLNAQKVDISIYPGDTVVCTFTDRQDATLTVAKSAPDDPAQTFQFTWDADQQTPFQLTDGQSQQAVGLAPGVYHVAEANIPTDWYLDGVNGEHPECSGATSADYSLESGATVTINAGDDVVCTFSDFFDYRPEIQVEKSASRAFVIPGQTVDYGYVVTNTGNTVLTPPNDDRDQVLVDNKCSPVTYVSGDTGDDHTMDPGEAWTFTCAGYQVDVDTTNEATGTMRPPVGEPVTGTATEFVEVLPPDMVLVKSVDQPIVYPGTSVTYTYDLLNTGWVDLQNQASPNNRDAWVADDKCAAVTYLSGDTGDDKILGVGETWTYECSTPISVDTTNVATATATALDPNGGQPVGQPLTSTDQATVRVIVGGITITKTATAPGGTVKDGTLLVPLDTTVTYTYEVTSGSATVGMQVLDVTDNKCTPVVYKSGDTNDDGLVDPGETWKYECQRLFDGIDTITNTVAITAVEPTLGAVSTASAEARVTSFKGSVALTKTPSTDLVPKGGSVTYTYKATNDGSSDLTQVTLTDDKCSPVNYRSGDDGDGILKPGETWMYECTATIDRSVTNVAVVTGKTPNGGTVTTSTSTRVTTFDPTKLDAKIKIRKSANKSRVKKGGKVVYTYKVSNPGRVTLARVKNHVSDNKCSKVKYIKGDKDRNNLLTSGTEGSDFPKETWTYKCRAKLKKSTINIATARGTGWRDGQIIGPKVKSKDAAKVVVIGSHNGGGGK